MKNGIKVSSLLVAVMAVILMTGSVNAQNGKTWGTTVPVKPTQAGGLAPNAFSAPVTAPAAPATLPGPAQAPAKSSVAPNAAPAQTQAPANAPAPAAKSKVEQAPAENSFDTFNPEISSGSVDRIGVPQRSRNFYSNSSCAPACMPSCAPSCDISCAPTCDPCYDSCNPCYGGRGCGAGLASVFHFTMNVIATPFVAVENMFANCGSYGCGSVCGSACEPACAPSCAPVCEPACAPSCAPVCEPACAPSCAPVCEPACGYGRCRISLFGGSERYFRPSFGSFAPYGARSAYPCGKKFGSCGSCGVSCGTSCAPACAPSCAPSCAPVCEPACAPSCAPSCFGMGGMFVPGK